MSASNSFEKLGPLEKSALNYMNERNKINQINLQNKKNLQDQQIYDFKSPDQQRKDLQLKAAIDKEEIFRTLDSRNKGQYNSVEKSKQEEIKKLAQDREIVRQREEQLMNQISKIQNDIFDNDRGLISRDSGIENSYGRINIDQRNINELELAMNREEQVQQIRFEKDRLENERQRILQELNHIKKNQQEPVSFSNSAGFRKNLSAVRAGSAVTIENQRFQGDPLVQQRPPQRIEPSIKDKLIYDQARINKLREQQQQLRKEADDDLNNLDTLDRELKNHTNFYDEAEDFVESYSAKKINEKETLAKKILNNMDMVSASPITKPRGGNLNSLPPRPVQQPSYQHIQQGSFLNQNTPVFQNSQSIPVIPKKQVNFSQNEEKMKQNFIEQNQYIPIRNKPITQDPMIGNIHSLAEQTEEENRRLKQAIEAEGENRRLKEALEYAQKNLIYNPQAMGIPQNIPYYGMPNELMQNPQNIEPQDLPSQKKPIADEFLFRQNESRVEDLDAEERALMNLQAQEFDQLRIIERLPKDSEIYQYKLKQFKELSALRAEAEKVLHEQRIEKMKRDFEKQKLEEVRQVQHQAWLENQKRAVIAARLSGVQMNPNVPQYQNNFQATQQDNQDRSPSHRELTESIRSFGKSSQKLRLNDDDQDDNQPEFAGIKKKDTILQQDQGFLVQVDYIYHLPSHMKVKQAKITICAFKDDEAFGTPQLIGPAIVEPDMTNKNFDKVLFFQKLVFKQIPKMADMRLALELQAFNPANPKVFEGMGWSWINIFEKDTLKVRAGKWTIPVYQGPTRPAYASIPSKRPPLAPDVTVSIRIGLSGDQIFNGEPSSQVDLTDFPIPHEHASVGYEIAASLDKNQREMNRQKRQIEKQKTLKEINLDGKSPEPKSPDAKSPDVRESLKVPKPQEQEQIQKNPDIIPKVPQKPLGTMTVRLLFSKNIKIHSRLQVRCTLHTGESGIINQNDGKPCEFKSITIEDNDVLPIQVGQLVEIADPLVVVEHMDRNKSYSEMATLNAQVRPMKSQEFTWDFQSIPGQIFLVEVFAKISNKKSLASYSTFEIQNDKGDIQFGFHEVQLNKPDIKFRKRDQVAISGESFGLELINPANPKPVKIKKEPGMRIDKDEATSQISRVSEQFIPNFNKQFTFSEPWAQADGLDIYFDGCRHLPDNVSVTKIQMRVVDLNFVDIAPPLDAVANIQKSSIRNQTYTQAKYQLGIQNLRPTALLYIKIFSIDESDKVPCCVGYSYFPLFMNSQNRMPVILENVQQFSPHLGYYQMPIYHEKPNEKAPFTYERFIKLDRIPTSTVIIRIQKAVGSAQQKSVKFEDSQETVPIYKDGLYSTAYCNVSEEEHDIMKFRRLYLDANLQDVLDWAVFGMKGAQAESMNQEQKIEAISSYISSAFVPKPINLEYFSRYFPKLGFRVNIEAIHNNQAKGFLVVMCSILPSAQYYLYNPSQGQPRGPLNDAFIFSDPDFESHNQTYKFQEGDACIVGFEPTENRPSLFFDIKIYEKDKDSFSDYGFACMPYLQLLNGDEHTHKENYIMSGIFSLPVYRGSLKTEQMKAIIQDMDPLLAIRSMATRKDIQLRDKASIIVRVVDQQRKLHYLKSFEEMKPNLRFLEQSQIQTHSYNKIEEGGFFGGPEKLKNLLPDKFKKNPGGFKQHLAQKFNQFMKL